jgi:chromosome transmission fidelity protein 1
LERVDVDNEPEWVLEYEREERRIATEVRKRDMEERIARVREKERRDKFAAKKGNGRTTKRRVISHRSQR